MKFFGSAQESFLTKKKSYPRHYISETLNMWTLLLTSIVTYQICKYIYFSEDLYLDICYILGD